MVRIRRIEVLGAPLSLVPVVVSHPDEPFRVLHNHTGLDTLATGSVECVLLLTKVVWSIQSKLTITSVSGGCLPELTLKPSSDGIGLRRLADLQ